MGVIEPIRHLAITNQGSAQSWLQPMLDEGCWPRRAQRSECGTDLIRKKLRLFPGREVAALVDPVVIDDFGIRPLRPTPRGSPQRLQTGGSEALDPGKPLTLSGHPSYTAYPDGAQPCHALRRAAAAATGRKCREFFLSARCLWPML